jgi:hypothetical protein
MIQDLFEFASGTMPGRSHVGRNGLLFGQNNQDGSTILTYPDNIIAVVTDGCGSQSQSEVGARLGARMLAAAVSARLRQTKGSAQVSDPRFWERVRLDLLARLRVLALELAGDRSLTDTIAEYFLFTAIVTVITPTETVVAGIGDGLVCLNGEEYELGPYPGNKPPYLAYGLVETEFDQTPEVLKFDLVITVPTDEVQSLLIGTDGAIHLRDAAQRYLPGRNDLVGDLSKVWQEDRFFRNRDNIRRWLALANSSVTFRSPHGGDIVTEEGLLPDDTTLVVLRRKRKE